MVDEAAKEGAVSEQVFRHCAPAHTDLDQTLEHTKAVGGRYNPPGEFGAVYVSRDQKGLLRELDRRSEKLGIRREDLPPRTLLTLDLHVKRVLDLTDAAVREAWGADIEDLIREDDYSRCHEVARSDRRPVIVIASGVR